MHDTLAAAAISLALIAGAPTPRGEVPADLVLFNANEASWTAGGGPGSLRAAIYGDPGKPGAYLHLISVPPNTVSRAHKYTDRRTYTVIRGTWYLGLGFHYDKSKLLALPAGSYYELPADTPVFNATAEDGATIQIGGTGPTEHIDLEPDISSNDGRAPRRQNGTQDSLPPNGSK